MKLIAGLGNPGERYEGTRHNVGFMAVDNLVREFGNEKPELRMSNKHQALVAKTDQLILAKPQTFMNGSGESIWSLCRYYRVALSELYVVHDDLDIELGEYKVQFGKGPKIHNGINSINTILGTDQYWRIRVGVENRQGETKIPGKKYLLENFLAEEKELLSGVLDKVTRELKNAI